MRVRVDKKNAWTPIALMGGFAEVENNEVTILVNGAERGDSIDRAAAESAYTKAQAALDNANDSQSRIKATQSLKRARARFQAAGGMV